MSFSLKFVASHGAIWTPSNRPIWFLEPTRAHNPNGISIGSAVFAQVTAECRRCRELEACPSPLELSLPLGDLNPHLIHGSLGPPDSASQTASRSVQPFCTAYDCDRPTDIQITLRSVTIGGIYDSTLCLKNVPPLTCYDLDKHDPLATSFGRSVTEKVRNQMVLFPTSTV